MGQKLSEGFPCRPCARHSNTLAAGRWLSKKCLTACGLWLRVLTVPSRGGEPATNARGRRPWDPASPASTRSPLTHAGAGADPHSARLSVLNGPARIRPIPESSPIEPRGGERDGEESSRRILEVWTKTEEEILAETTAASSIRGGGFARAPTTAGPAPTPSSSPTRLQVIIREASKRIQEHQSWKYRIYSGEGPSDVTPIDRLDSPNAKVTASSRHNFQESKGRIPESDSILLHKLEEVCQSVKILSQQ
uniref:Uncharacterized protein n=1 Tax=Oryza nivara TaxID=4536 RepID=A0A0E0GAA5_ORYNI